MGLLRDRTTTTKLVAMVTGGAWQCDRWIARPRKPPCRILFGASISIRCEDMADGNLTGHQTTDVIYQSYIVLLLVSSRPIIIVLTVLLGSCLQSCCILIIKYCKNLAVADYFTYLKLTKNTNTYIFTPNCKQIHLHI